MLKYTKKDIIVILCCVIFLLMNIGAIGSGSRKRAKEIICLSNLRQWGQIFSMYIEDNDGRFPSGLGRMGYWWPLQLEDDIKDWKNNETWFCPTATRPITDENGVITPTLNIFNAWGIYRETQGQYNSGTNGIAGSYSINGFVLSIPLNSTFSGGIPASDGWREPNVVGSDKVPLFIDALRFDLWPSHTNPPAQNEFAAWSGNNMARCCINRHNGSVNSLFLDFSARKVGLKELWTLKWHRSFNTEGPWTMAGGVISSDWPEWMRNFKDF